MNIKVAIPDNPLYEPLLARAGEVCARNGFELIRTDEARCAELLLRNSVELALISPLGYGQGVQKVDYRIVKGPALVVEGFTGLGSIYFREGISDVHTCAVHAPESFLVRIGRIVLGEKFGLHLETRHQKGSPAELLQQNDAVIALGNDPELPVSLDISDEWMDLTNESLPVLFWVCRPDDMPENLEDIVDEMVKPDWPRALSVEEDDNPVMTENRSGKIFWQWNESTEPALQKTLEMLFYLQDIPAISAVKIFGRDPIDE